MSELNDVAIKTENPGRARLIARTVKVRGGVFLLYYFWPSLPLIMGVSEIVGGVRESRAETVTMGASWVIVAVVGFLACHATYRIKVNITQHRRPFTEKDHKFCHLAQNAAMVTIV